MLRYGEIANTVRELRPELIISHDPGEDEGVSIALPDLSDFNVTNVGVSIYEGRIEFHNWTEELASLTGKYSGESDAYFVAGFAIDLMDRLAEKNKEAKEA